MARVPRIYHGILREHLARHRQMAFVASDVGRAFVTGRQLEPMRHSKETGARSMRWP